MAKRRRKGSGRGRGLGWIGSLFRGIRRLVAKIFPLLLIASVAAGLFFGVRKLLYADSGLMIQEILVEPPDALYIKSRSRLETAILGKNILQVDLKAISKLLEQNPEIRQARVIRSLPSTLRVQIVKRKPIAYIRFSPRGSFGLVGDDGMILDLFSKRDASFVLIEAFRLGIRKPVIGTQIKNRGFMEAVKFLKAFRSHPLARRETVTKISIDHLDNLSITLGAGPDIKLGRDPVSHLKDLEKIIYLLEGEGRQKIDYVDLQFDNVIVKRKW